MLGTMIYHIRRNVILIYVFIIIIITIIIIIATSIVVTNTSTMIFYKACNEPLQHDQAAKDDLDAPIYACQNGTVFQALCGLLVLGV